MKRLTIACLSVMVLGAGCAQHLPDQDLRILDASPAAKLTTPMIMFVQKGAGENVGVEARLLDDRVAQTTKDTAAGQRITLRCFVEGLETNLILKSCIKL
jgi:hypothetical protein